MIVLFTDFSLKGPYVGQLKSAIFQNSPDSKTIDLIHDAPVFDIKHSAYMLNSLTQYFPVGSVFCCVVDPGVGSDRNAIVVKSNDNFFVGPANGLFEYVCRSDSDFELYNIVWSPDVLSTTFHGRDIFAPIAAQIDNNVFDSLETVKPEAIKRFSWPNDLLEIIYIDHFGNLMTGIQATSISSAMELELNGHKVIYASTYANMPEGQLCWYINSNQLIEIGLNQKNTALVHGVKLGDCVKIIT